MVGHPGHQALANAYAKIGRYDDALQAIDKAIEISPTESYFVLYQGGYLAEAGRLDSAVATYQAYLTMNQKPFYAFVARRIADIYVVNCRYEQADSIYSLSDGYPDSIQRGQGRLETVNPLLHQGRFNEALVQLQKGIEIDQAELGYSEPMCWKYDRQGLINLLFLDDPESALVDYRLAEKVHETLPSKTRSQAASIFGAQTMAIATGGEITEAKKMLDEAVEQTAPDEADLRRAYNYYLAYVHRLAGEFDESTRLMETLASEEPNFINQLYLGVSYLGADRVDDAVRVLEKAMARYDDSRFNSWGQSVMGHYYHGQAYEGAGRTGEAIEQYGTFLDIWKNADEGLKSVEDARERLARLKETI